MRELTKRESFEMFLNGAKVEVSKKPTYVTARWVENYDLVTKASGTIENERPCCTGWLVQPHSDRKNLYVIGDAEFRKRYKPCITESALYEDGEEHYYKLYARHGGTFVSVPQTKQVVFVAEDITFPDPWEGSAFKLLAGGVLVDNGDGSVYGINPVEFWNTHERAFQ